MQVKSVLVVLFSFLSISLSTPLSVHAEILAVPNDFETIQTAIDAAEDGDTVLISEGEYFENIDYNGKCLAVGSLFLINGEDLSLIHI